MSFTAEVKDELSHVEASHVTEELALLAALMRICGTLSMQGNRHVSVRVATETGTVARLVIKLVHKLLNLETSLTVRRSILHKTRNYLIEIPDQERLAESLVLLGILTPEFSLNPHVPEHLCKTDELKGAFLRGAFMAAGFVGDPRGALHLEIAVSGHAFAEDIQGFMRDFGVHARMHQRRGLWSVYLKSFEDIQQLLTSLSALRMAQVVEVARMQKSLKNEVNRLVNAELANSARTSKASADQLRLIDQIEAQMPLHKLPRALHDFCVMRRKYPELSLVHLGEKMRPPVSKSALYHRILRLQKMLKTDEDHM